MLEFTESRKVPRTSGADGDKFRVVMANGVKLALKIIFKTIQQLKIQVFPRIKVSLGR